MDVVKITSASQVLPHTVMRHDIGVKQVGTSDDISKI
jgi:hypothetical protein